MKKKPFVIADVFTTKRFGGNQLAVFTDGSELDTETMQAIALEMNYSETTFLLPPEKGGDAKVRIFTPSNELPFAGHPLVGTGFVIVAENWLGRSQASQAVKLETGVGEIQVSIEMKNGRPGHTVMTQPLPVVRSQWSDTHRMAKALSIEVSDIDSTSFPVEVIYNGIPVMIIPIASLAAVEKIKVETAALEAISREAGAITVLTFARETVHPENTVHCRVFVPAQGIPEDAATGSANGPLGFYVVRHKLVDRQSTTSIISEQGFEMRRPSILHIDIDLDPTLQEIKGVRVGGGVVITGRGEMILSE